MRRGNKKLLIFMLIIILLIFVVYAYQNDFNGIKSKIENNIKGSSPNYVQVSIKDLTNNPSLYVNKNISVEGILGNFMDSLYDKEGYFVKLNGGQFGKCFDWEHRNYYTPLYNQDTLKANGIFNKNYEIECDYPL